VYGGCSPKQSLILLCGVSERDLDQPSASSSSGRKISYHFPKYRSWHRLHYDGDVEPSVLAKKLKTFIAGGQSVEVELLQETARCEV